jgi:glyoxylase-like metal-dependent hydrolase (beta-lactamase superfamily II)
MEAARKLSRYWLLNDLQDKFSCQQCGEQSKKRSVERATGTPMKKLMKSVLIIVGVALGLLVLLAGAYLLIFQSQTGKMTPLESQEFIEDVYAIQDSSVNMFLIKGDDQYIAIDAGNSVDHIRQELDKLNINAEEVAAVFLTHTDADHTAALSLFGNATIYISKAEEQMIDGRTPRFVFVHNSFEYEPKLVKDGQVVNVSGLKVQGILTPGHTPGAMSFLIDDKYLFVGDSMSLEDGKINLFNEFFNMDSETQRASLKKLADLSGVEYLFTAHYGVTDDYAKAFSAWAK